VRVLLDTRVATSAKAVLREAGHEVDHVGNWSEDPGDAAVLAYPDEHGFVVITLDKDFGELAVIRGHAHRGIIRLVDIESRLQGEVAVAVLAQYGPALSDGAIVTAEPTRTRIRPPSRAES
jgi:predicted nuclease of predicted toxin-antitoxin system